MKPKRRNIIHLVAKKRSAGPMKSKLKTKKEKIIRKEMDQCR